MTKSPTRETFVSDQGNVYEFSYQKIDGRWRIYIDRQPSYGRLNTDSIHTHRYGIDTHSYVCWSKPLNKRSHAVAVAHHWANWTDRYIANGHLSGSPVPTIRSWLNRLVGLP